MQLASSFALATARSKTASAAPLKEQIAADRKQLPAGAEAAMAMFADAPLPAFTADATRSLKASRIAEARARALPDGFTKNTLKESLVLEYVENFRKQFIQLYPDRRPLLLTPANEAGTPKFVCTTLRPTLMPMRELYDMQACARFLATYIHYEPLEVPTEIPAVLPSPSFTIENRIGDAFEMATVLCSYLLGSGHDAYVVWGTAPRWITLKAEDRAKCGWSAPPDAIDRTNHTTPEVLRLAPPKRAGAGAASAAGAAAAGSGGAAGSRPGGCCWWRCIGGAQC